MLYTRVPGEISIALNNIRDNSTNTGGIGYDQLNKTESSILWAIYIKYTRSLSLSRTRPLIPSHRILTLERYVLHRVKKEWQEYHY